MAFSVVATLPGEARDFDPYPVFYNSQMWFVVNTDIKLYSWDGVSPTLTKRTDDELYQSEGHGTPLLYNGSLYVVGTVRSGLFRYNNTMILQTVINPSTPRQILSVIVFNNSIFALSSTGELLRWSSGSNWSVVASSHPGVHGDSVLFIYGNRLWYTGQAGRCYRWNNSNAWTISIYMGNDDASITSALVKSSDGYLYVSGMMGGSDSGSLWRYNGSTWTKVVNGLTGDYLVSTLYEYSNQIHMVDSNGKAYVWSGGSTWVNYYSGSGVSEVIDLFIFNDILYLLTFDNILGDASIPVVAFTGTPLSGIAPLSVAFSDSSTGATSWLWDFGDGNTSTTQNPTHVYAAGGIYTVSLTVNGAYGLTKPNYITASPTANFTGTPVNGDAPLTVNFTDLSTGSPSLWYWDFGDGGVSTLQNPSHIYATAGVYTVSLTVTAGGVPHTLTRTNYIAVDLNPSFIWNPSAGPAPLTVSFTDTTVGDPTGWTWDFGDGSPVSNLQNPSHIYTEAGVYSVLLTATRGTSSRSVIYNNIITVGVLADFTADVTTGVAPLTVNFTDLSLGDPTSWLWNFGDSNTSTLQNPSHTYASPGTYTVTLTASKGPISHTTVKTNYIRAIPPLTADFVADVTAGATPLTVQFTDLSLGEPQTWSWSFGDGNTSTLQNPVHTYENSGVYTVTLTTTNGAQIQTLTRTNYITVVFQASFTSDVREGDAPLPVNFLDISQGNPLTWSWNFGDGTTSSEQNPSHVYYRPGFYTVSLLITRNSNTSLVTIKDYIYVRGGAAVTTIATDDIAPPVERIVERTMYAQGTSKYIFIRKGVRISKPAHERL